MISEARLEDVEQIVANNLAMALETEGKQLDPQTVRAGTLAVLQNPSLGRYIVSREGSRITGQLMLTFEWSDWRNGVFWWIQSVYVLPPYRRQGIYRRLYSWLRESGRADESVCGLRLYVDRNNRVAQRVYSSLGMAASHYELYEEDWVLDPPVPSPT